MHGHDAPSPERQISSNFPTYLTHSFLSTRLRIYMNCHTENGGNVDTPNYSSEPQKKTTDQFVTSKLKNSITS